MPKPEQVMDRLQEEVIYSFCSNFSLSVERICNSAKLVDVSYSIYHDAGTISKKETDAGSHAR